MGSTKKTKSAAKYGARFGIGIRKRWLKVAEKQKKRYDCPNCGFTKVKRLSAGIFKCKKCSLEFAGGAYFPTTLTGAIVNKMIEQKQFLPAMTELIAATEKTKGLVEETEPTANEKQSKKEPSETKKETHTKKEETKNTEKKETRHAREKEKKQ